MKYLLIGVSIATVLLTGCFEQKQENTVNQDVKKTKIDKVEPILKPERAIVEEKPSSPPNLNEIKAPIPSLILSESAQTTDVKDINNEQQDSKLSQTTEENSVNTLTPATPALESPVEKVLSVKAENSSPKVQPSQANQKTNKQHKKAKSKVSSDVLYSEEEARIGGYNTTKPLSAAEIEYSKYKCLYSFSSQKEAKRYHCDIKVSVVNFK